MKSSSLIVEEMADEFYLQLYRQCNTTDPQVSLKPIFLVMAFLTRYMRPSTSLLPYYDEWLHRKMKTQGLERYIRHALTNLKILVNCESQLPSDKNTHVTWPPSVSEISALDHGKHVKVKVVFPDEFTREFEVDEATTVESLMNDKIFTSHKLFKLKMVEKQFYWLFTMEEDSRHFPTPISKEKRILKLLYSDEKQFEKETSFDD